MAVLQKDNQLKKELSFFSIYTIATGATIASGFFLLPGLAAAQAGPAVILSYLIAALPIFPALFSKVELSTAMPRAGGIYYFLDRSMGPLFGTIGGIGTWLALILKSSFALVGIGAYVNLFFPEIAIEPIACGFAILIGILNLFGAKKTGAFQSILVIGLLALLLWFFGNGFPQLNPQNFSGFFDKGFDSILGTAGFVYVSYVGLTKIFGITEEIRDPEKNIPLPMFLALGTAILVYAAGTTIMISVVPPEQLHNDLTPAATAAEILVGRWGAILMSIAAILAFFSAANAGVLSVSRYPLAMSRDHLLPGFFRKLTSRHQSPGNSVFSTVGIILICLILLDPIKIAKLASAFLLLLFSLNCLAVIVMRESHIESYDPGYRSPLYPWMQIVGIILPFWLIAEMGWLPILFTVGLVGVGVGWYFYYARKRVIRDGAIYHIFARLGERRFEGLDRDLRGILMEKGLRDQDPFDAVVASASVIDLSEKMKFEKIVELAAEQLENQFPGKKEALVKGFMQGTLIGATPVSHGVALPHMRLPNINHPEMVMVRTHSAVQIKPGNHTSDEQPEKKPVNAIFFLVSPDNDPGQHLRILAQIASHVDRKFLNRWLDAENEQELKEILLRDDHFISLVLRENSKTAVFINHEVRDLALPEGCLITLIHREGNIIVPHGRTLLHADDRLTIIGYPDGIQELYEMYEE